MSVTGEPTTAHFAMELGNDPIPLAALPPQEPVRRKRPTQAVAVVALLGALAYLTWRAVATLNLGVWWISLPLIGLEVYAAIGLAVLTTSLWDLDALAPVAKRAGTGQRIAVLIPTFNEPEEVLLPTVAAAVPMHLAHETWVLDDGNRPWVATLARQLGANYLARADHDHAKAGNVNHALSVVDADLVAILDADHVASADFLASTVGYFDDPRIALVQTPQDFYNLDSFEHRDDYNEQRLFYRAIGPGRNRWNAAFCCGTGAILRVSALDEIGGLATETITEDIHTTLRLHRRGWKSAYHNEVLAHGLGAADASQYLKQRLRWGTGAMQVLRQENPTFVSNLSFMQRLSYLETLLGWFDAWRTLGYLLAPIVVLWTAAVPIRAPLAVFAPAFLSAFLLQRYALRRLSRGMAPQGIATVFEMVRMPTNLRATLSLFSRGPHAFSVTEKGRSGERRERMPAPGLLWLLLGVSAATLAWALATILHLTPIRYSVPWVAYGSLAWLALNGSLLVAAIARIRSKRFGSERRAAVRFRVDAPASLDGEPVQLLDISLTGALVELADGLPGPAPGGVGTLRIRLHARTHSIAVTGRSNTGSPTADHARARAVGLEYAPGQTDARAALALALFQTGVEPTIGDGTAAGPSLR